MISFIVVYVTGLVSGFIILLLIIRILLRNKTNKHKSVNKNMNKKKIANYKHNSKWKKNNNVVYLQDYANNRLRLDKAKKDKPNFFSGKPVSENNKPKNMK